MHSLKIAVLLIVFTGGIFSAAAQKIASDKTTGDGVRTIATNAIPVYSGKLISVAASAMIKGSDTAYFLGFYKQQLDLSTDVKNDPSQNSCTITLADGSKAMGQYVQIIQVEGNDIFSYPFSRGDFKKLALQDAIAVSMMSPVGENLDFKLLNKFQANINNTAAKILNKLR